MAGEGTKDMVNSPPHYRAGGLEAIEVAEDWQLMQDAYLFSAFRYVIRAGRKGEALEDLRKARWYLERGLCRPYSRRYTGKDEYASSAVAAAFGMNARLENVLIALQLHDPYLAHTSVDIEIGLREAQA